MKKSLTPSPVLKSNPVAISKAIDRNHHHVILHKQGKGYSFTVFWVSDEKKSLAEPVAKGPKTFRTKEECIDSIKKLYDSTPKLFSAGYACYDYDMRIIDTYAQYDAKKMIW